MTFALATLILAAQGPLMEGSGNITSRQYENKIYDGNKVIATEWMTLDYTVTWELVDSGVWEGKGYYISCDNDCKGKKHPNHGACDLSCDKQCAKTHKLTMRGKYEPLRDQMRRARLESGEAARASGGTAASQDWSSASTNALQEARRMAQKLVDKPIDHWNTSPCSVSTKEWGWRRWDFKIKGKFTKHIVRMESGRRTERTEPGAEHSATVAYVWLPDNEGRNEIAAVACLCSAWPVDPPKIGTLFERMPFFPGVGWRTLEGKVILGETDGCKFECVGQDLNQLVCTGETTVPGVTECIFYAGALCVPDDPAYQTMCVLRTGTFACNSGDGFVDMLAAPTKIRAACLELHKKEPNGNVKFRIVKPTNQGVVNLAAMSNKSRSIGPFDQARIWILTDQATISEINKRMLPGVTEGQYMNALYDVNLVGGVDATAGKFTPCLQPSLLLGATASSDATRWLVDAIGSQNPKLLVNYLKSDAPKFSKLLGGAPDEFDLRHAADLCDAVLGSNNSGVRSAGLTFMVALPVSRRADLLQRGALDSLGTCLNSGDAVQTAKALEVAVVYRFEDALPMIRGLAEWSKSAEIRKSAEDALKKFAS